MLVVLRPTPLFQSPQNDPCHVVGVSIVLQINNIDELRVHPAHFLVKPKYSDQKQILSRSLRTISQDTPLGIAHRLEHSLLVILTFQQRPLGNASSNRDDLDERCWICRWKYYLQSS